MPQKFIYAINKDCHTVKYIFDKVEQIDSSKCKTRRDFPAPRPENPASHGILQSEAPP